MRKINLVKQIVILGMLSVSFQTYSQSDIAISFGWRNHFGGMDAVNNIISQYNVTRPWLDNTLGTHNFQNGFEIRHLNRRLKRFPQ